MRTQHFSAFGLVPVLVLALTLIPCDGAWAQETAPVAVTGGERGGPPDAAAGAAARLLYLINVERDRAGLMPLRAHEALTRSAQLHSDDMAYQDFCNHVGSNGSTLMDRVSGQGYPYTTVGENLAAGLSTVEKVVSSWMASSGHRANMLNPAFVEAGLGYTYQPDDKANIRLPNGKVGGPYYHYYTLDLASRPGAYPVVIDLEAPTSDDSVVDLAIGGSGWARDLMISSTPGFSGARWQPFVQRTTWTLLPGNGVRRVYVRLRHASGQEVDSFDDIEVIGQEPAASRRGFVPLVSR